MLEQHKELRDIIHVHTRGSTFGKVEAGFVVLGSEMFPPSGRALSDVVDSVAEHFRTPKILVQIGPREPPICEFPEPPVSWSQVSCSREGRLFNVPTSSNMTDFTNFFDLVVRSRGEWLFYLLNDDEVQPWRSLRLFGPETLARKDCQWRALVWHDTDTGFLIMVLPIGATTDEYVSELSRIGPIR